MNAALLGLGFRRHAPSAHDLGGAWWRSALATLAMATALPFLRLFDGDAPLLHRALGNVAFPILVGIAIYVAMHVLLRSPELGALRRRKRGAGAAPR